MPLFALGARMRLTEVVKRVRCAAFSGDASESTTEPPRAPSRTFRQCSAARVKQSSQFTLGNFPRRYFRMNRNHARGSCVVPGMCPNGSRIPFLSFGKISICPGLSRSPTRSITSGMSATRTFRRVKNRKCLPPEGVWLTSIALAGTPRIAKARLTRAQRLWKSSRSPRRSTSIPIHQVAPQECGAIQRGAMPGVMSAVRCRSTSVAGNLPLGVVHARGSFDFGFVAA